MSEIYRGLTYIKKKKKLSQTRSLPEYNKVDFKWILPGKYLINKKELE